jgi:hypothetical protein
MAINFLQNVSLNNTELQNFKVQNVTSDPSVTGEGQLIYRSDANVLKFYNGASWVTLDTNAGTVTSVGISSNYFTIGSTPITSSGIISVNMPNSGVTAQEYTHATITVNAQGVVTAASSGTATLGVTSFTNANGTFVSAGTENTTATGAVSMGTIDLSAGGTPSSSTFLRGDNTWATVPGGYTSWTLQGDSGSNLTVVDGTTVDISGATGIGTATTAAGITLTNTGVTSAVAGSNISVSGATGAVTIAYTGPTGSMSSWTMAGDSGSQSISDTNIVTFTGGIGLTTAAAATDVLTISLDNTSVTAASYTSANITVDAQGRITAASDGGAGTMTSWTIGSSTGSNQTVSNGQVVDVVGGTYISGSIAGTRTVTLAHDATSRSNTATGSSPGSAGTFDVIDTVTTNSTGHITGVNTTTVTMPTSPTTYSGWLLTGDSGTSANVTPGATATFQGGTGITTSSNGFILDIQNDGVLTNVAGTGIGVSGASGNVTITNTGVTSAVAGSNISVSSATGAVTIAYTGGTGSMSSWTLAADSGSSQSITDGNTVTIQGSTGIDTTVSATDDVTINLDLNELSTTTTWASATDFLAVVDLNGANAKILSGNIPINDWGNADGDIVMDSNKITGLANGTSGTDAVNLNQLNSAVIGLLEFKGGFNASTGVIDGGATNLTSGAGRVAIAVGDFYVVTTAGNFFGNTAEPLSIGDQVICITAAATGTSVQGDFVEVQANIDIATTTTVGLVSVPTSGGINVNGSGAISLDSGANASSGSATQTSVITTNAYGQVTSQADATIAIPASQITDFCAAVTNCIGTNHNFTANIGNNAATSYVLTHNLGTRDVMVQAYRNESPYDTVNLSVERTSTSTVTLSTVTALGNSEVRVMISEIL